MNNKKASVELVKYVNVIYLKSGGHILVPIAEYKDQMNFIDVMKQPDHHNMEKIENKLTGQRYDFEDFTDYKTLSLEGFKREFPEEMSDIEDIVANS